MGAWEQGGRIGKLKALLAPPPWPHASQHPPLAATPCLAALAAHPARRGIPTGAVRSTVERRGARPGHAPQDGGGEHSEVSYGGKGLGTGELGRLVETSRKSKDAKGIFWSIYVDHAKPLCAQAPSILLAGNSPRSGFFRAELGRARSGSIRLIVPLANKNIEHRMSRYLR